MLATLHQATAQARYGNKISQLIQLIQLGYQVPPAYIFDADQVKTVLAKTFQVEEQDLLTFEQIMAYGQKGINHQALLSALHIQLETKLGDDMWQPGKVYIVRSSGSLEDSKEYAHAGLFESVAHCRNLTDLLMAMKDAIVSIFTPAVQSYYQRHRLQQTRFQFALLIQEQIEADWSGVAFSLNPSTGADQEFVLEVVEGEGAALVAGQAEPQRFTYQVQQDLTHSPSSSLLSQRVLNNIWQIVDQLRQFYAYPIDIELCGKGEQIFLLQVRSISQPPLQIDDQRWTTTNFRDGGVSAQVATPLIWSLYRDTWSQSLGNFVLDQGLWQNQPLPALICYHFGRIYWNLGLVKSCMAQVPGYVEAEFDDELGVPKHYKGLGFLQPFGWTRSTELSQRLFRFILTDRKKRKEAPTFLAQLSTSAQAFENKFKPTNARLERDELKLLWQQLVDQAYRQSEEAYFQRVFLNTVQFPYLKKILYRKLTESEFFALISDLANLSHRRLDRALDHLTQTIAQDPSEQAKWLSSSAQALNQDYRQQQLGPSQKLLDQFLKTYGYHSLRELNLQIPSFMEDPLPIIQAIQKNLQRTSKPEPEPYSLKHNSAMIHSLNPLERRLLKHLRDLLWLREEYKDLSTRYYHLIRQLALRVGEYATRQDDLDQVEDIFYLDHVSIRRYLHGETPDLRDEVDSAKAYVRSFASYSAPLELYPWTTPLAGSFTENEGLSGVGANQGYVQGRVRVIEQLTDLDQIEANEILVTPFLDTGWVHIFSQLRGIITETGGILSHGAIMAREYQLPVIVSAKGITSLLQTGDWIAMDGLSGSIQLMQKREGV